MNRINVVSISGGIDSLATGLLCRELNEPESIRYVTADTGNEHPITYEYWEYLRGALGHLDVVKADFTAQIARKAVYVVEHWPKDGIPAAVIDRAIAALVPTGNPYLDLCIWKGRFPSRKPSFARNS